jgi:putative aldouronate transport system substrate-binding protein
MTPAFALTSSSQQSANKENITLSVAVWDIQTGFNDPNAKKDTIQNNLQKKLNITIKPIQITWNDWQDKMKIWGASNQLPDLIANLLDPALYNTFAKQGIIKAIPTDLSKYPNIKSVLSLSDVQSKKLNGKFYFIPRGSSNGDAYQACLSRVFVYRKDWLKEVGLSEPQSFDEYVKAAKAVLKKHPDAVGLSINTKNYLSEVFLWSFPQAALDSSWVKENGTWIPSYASEQTYTGIKQLRTLYTEGILDKDFAIQKDADGTLKFQNGKAFSCFIANSFKPEQYAPTNKTTINDSIAFMMPFPTADGKRYSFNGTSYWSETYLNNKMDAKKTDRALQLMDYMLSNEYITMRSNGIQNVDWKISNGKAVSLLSQDTNLSKKYPVTDKFSWLGSWSGVPAWSSSHVFSANTDIAAYDKLYNADTYKRYQKNTVVTPINFNVMLMSTPLKDKADTYRVQQVDELIKVIIGKDDAVTMWKSAIDSLKAKGLDKAIKETNEYVKKLDIK